MRAPRFDHSASLALLLSAIASPSLAAMYQYSAILNARQEAPPVVSSAMGGGRFTIDTNANVDGRALRNVPATLYAPGKHAFEWDGRDDDGRVVGPGVYFAIARTPDGEKVTRIARLH